VVAPDTRGYNLSSKPEGFEDYGVDLLAADIRGLIGELGEESARLVGHDWGGSIAWITAMNHPEVVDRLAILNAAHPRRLQEGLRHPSQLRKSWYFFFFAVPGLPEEVVHARDWHFFRHWSSGVSAIPTSARTSPSPTATTCSTSTAWSAYLTRRTGCITTRLNASTNCSSTSSPPPAQPSTAKRQRHSPHYPGLGTTRLVPLWTKSDSGL
jgi:pimeloyl-ACP methyl ester carboxylesterase